MKETNKYSTPRCAFLEVFSEGVLCGSFQFGAGSLNNNSWNLSFGEDMSVNPNAGAGAGAFGDNSW